MWYVFESVHISAHIIYAVLTEKAVNMDTNAV